MDSITSSDLTYRDAMAKGSHELLQAIIWARKGYNPATREEPLKLPPDWSKRTMIDLEAQEEKRRESRRPANDRIREMMERGLSPKQIAKELKTNHQEIVWIMKSIRLERRSDRQMEMIRTGLWG